MESVTAYISRRLRHFFWVASRVRPLVWVSVYLSLVPVFALVYFLMPRSQFSYPAEVSDSFASWIYYSVVTITTLGFGDFTPTGRYAMAVTALEAILGLVMIGFFLNAVASLRMESEEDSEGARRLAVRQEQERRRLGRMAPGLIYRADMFLAWCYAATTPLEDRRERGSFNVRFRVSRMRDLLVPSGLPGDSGTRVSALEGVIRSARSLCYYLENMQVRGGMGEWPDVQEAGFGFVASCDLFGDWERLRRLAVLAGREDARRRVSAVLSDWKGEPGNGDDADVDAVLALCRFIRAAAPLAVAIEKGAMKNSIGSSK